MFLCGCCKNEARREKEAEREQDEVGQDGGEPLVTPLPVLQLNGAPKKDPLLAERADKAPIAAAKGSQKKKAVQAKHATDWQEKADRAFQTGEWEEALEGYSSALRLQPALAPAWAGRGGVKLRQGNVEEALTDLNEALRLDEHNLFAMRDRAEARMKTGDLEGAISDYNKKLMLAPGDGRALCGRGEAKLQQGDRAGAIRDFEFAARLTYPGATDLLSRAKRPA
mmetsp:Transcript_72795/g.165180  ORF Transcript_72795/g.165180 Transcript_72795/m.165180 type:complete len:225 (-) Transcript_72795:101-775(-)